MTFRVDAFPIRRLHRDRLAGPAAAHGRAERRDLLHGHLGAERAAQAEAGHDGERDHRDCRGGTMCCASPLAATRFRPTREMFAALNQPLPPEFAAAAGNAAPRAAGDQAVRASRVSNRPDPAPIAPRAGTPAAGGAARRPVTADSLFAPIEVRETRATAWVFENNQLKLVRLRLGTTDGSFSEVLNPDDIKPGTNVVMSMTTGLEARNATQTRQSSPLMGSQPGRGGFGGGRGG